MIAASYDYFKADGVVTQVIDPFDRLMFDGRIGR